MRGHPSRSGANVDKRDSLKQTPLHRAAHAGAVDCILALLELGHMACMAAAEQTYYTIWLFNIAMENPL